MSAWRPICATSWAPCSQVEKRKKKAVEKADAARKKLVEQAHATREAKGEAKELKKDEKLAKPVVVEAAAAPARAAAAMPPPAVPPQKAEPRNPEDNYEMSPPRDDSDDSDEEPRPKKKVPKWCSRSEIAAALERQQKMDPDKIFPSIALGGSCDLSRIFDNPRLKVDRRGESGCWTKDGLQMKEVELYRRMNGFK